MHWHESVTITKESKISIGEPAKRQTACHMSNMPLTSPLLNYSSWVISIQIYVKEKRKGKKNKQTNKQIWGVK